MHTTTKKSLDEFILFIHNNGEGLRPADAMLFLFLFAHFVGAKICDNQAAVIPFFGTFRRKEDGGIDFTPCEDLLAGVAHPMEENR